MTTPQAGATFLSTTTARPSTCTDLKPSPRATVPGDSPCGIFLKEATDLGRLGESPHSPQRSSDFVHHTSGFMPCRTRQSTLGLTYLATEV